MKPNSKHNRSLGSRANRVFLRARTQFGRAMIDALSTSLDALGGRLGGEPLGSFRDSGQVADQPRHRLRRMLQDDRGLGARNYDAPLAPAAADREREPRAERALELPINERAQEVVAAAPIETPDMLELSDAAHAPAETIEVATTSTAEPEPVLPLPAALAAAVSEVADNAATPAAEAVRSPAPDTETLVFCDEPIRTRSMARLLASQGHHRRALSIYEVLLAANTADATLQAEAAALRNLAEQPLATQQ